MMKKICDFFDFLGVKFFPLFPALFLLKSEVTISSFCGSEIQSTSSTNRAVHQTKHLVLKHGGVLRLLEKEFYTSEILPNYFHFGGDIHSLRNNYSMG